MLNSLDPTLVLKLFKALREMGKERYREAARSGNVPVLTAGAMDYISQATNIYEQVARDLQVREKQEAQE